MDTPSTVTENEVEETPRGTKESIDLNRVGKGKLKRK